MAAAIGRRALSDSVGLTWGSGHLGQLGHEHQGDHSTKARDGKYMERLPRTVDGLLGRGVKQVRSRARFRAGFTLHRWFDPTCARALLLIYHTTPQCSPLHCADRVRR